MSGPELANVNLGPFGAEWEAELQLEGKSPATVRTYIQGLRRAAAYLTPGRPFAAGAVDVASARSLIRAMQADGLAPQTMNTTLAALRHHLAWLVEEGHLTAEINWKQVRRRYRGALADPDRDPSHLQPTEVERLFAHAGRVLPGEPGGRVRWPARDLALLMLLAWGGLRVAEACALSVGSVLAVDDDGSRVLRVIGKGDKMRLLPLSPDAGRVLDAYLGQRVDRHGDVWPADPLLVGTDGLPLTSHKVTYLMEQLYKVSGVLPPAGAMVHGLRHTAAIQLAVNGVSASDVQNWLGHASLETSGRYLKVAGVELANAARASGVNKVMRRALDEEAAP